MADRTLGIAFLGCGFATRLHSRTLGSMPDVDRFYASRDAGKAADYARRYGGRGHFGSYADAIQDPRVDVVLIGTPPASHLQLALDALGAGKHVIVEKPPFLRSDHFDVVERAARAAGRRVFVAENYFYKPMAESLREVITTGQIGEVRILTVNALKSQQTDGWRMDEQLAGGGALYEGGIHWINFMANLGLTVRRVQGFRPGEQEGLEKTMMVVLEYEGGAVGTLYYSWEIGSPLKGLRLSAIYGTEGAVTFETNGLFLMVRGRRTRLKAPRPRDLLGYRAMFEDFFAEIRTGHPARFDLALARRDLELVEEVYRSIRTPRSGGADAATPLTGVDD